MQLPHIISTENFSKAMTLATLGVPLVDVTGKHAGNGDCPEYRVISDEELDQHGFRTIEEAEDAGFEGTIIYAFGEHPDRKAIAKAFDAAHHSQNASANIPDVVEIIDAGGKRKKVKTVELMAAFAAVLFRNRKKFADRRKKVRAKLHLKKSPEHFAHIDRRSSSEVKERFSK